MNVPELCSGLELVYLPAAWSFLVLPLWFIKWVWSSVYFKNDDFPLLKQDSPDRSNQRPWITSFSRVAGGKGRSSHRVTVAATVPSTPFGWFTSQPVARALTTAVRSAGGGPTPPASPQGYRSPLQHCTCGVLLALVSPNAQLCLLHWGIWQVLPGSFPWDSAGTLRAVNRGSHRSQPISFPSLAGRSLSSSEGRCFKNHFIYFFLKF